MQKKEKINKLLKKIEKIKKKHQLDLSSDEDLSIAIMNLLSLEEHLFFTGAKLKKPKYYGLMGTIRKMRSDLLKKIVKDSQGEIWCISKHLLATSMRLIEVGTKCLAKNKKKEAQDLFSKAYDLYSLFWGLNLKLLNPGDIKKIDGNKLNTEDEKQRGLMKELNELVEKMIDCCEE